ncbi:MULTISPECIES: DegT/DnrJ/EryC1/StrS family aminotransferase [unclassified Bradyrhizobium]|uniref:DegT/DnrJ/EryC1/StrS family aminotransferase n=1 Tax=unclassified Bradyrhizobium TaxID=2631580 RepID=UPI002FF04795
MSDIQMAGPWITEHEEKIVLDALRNGWYGKQAYCYVEKLEAEFASYHDRKRALMTPNCTTALHLLLAGLGVGEGDEVIAPDCTWIGSVAAITYQRATTIFADIDPIHWCLTAESIERAITPRTKAVIVVDLYGNMPDWNPIIELCKRRGITVIEDAAEALGSSYRGVRAGKFGVASTFSFHRTKTITTGEGGMLLIDDDTLFERCKFLRDHGRAPGTYFNTEVTFKYMPSNLQASLGYAQFQRLDELVERKRSIWKGYGERFSDIPGIQLNPEPVEVRNGVWNTALIFGKSLGMTRDMALTEMPKLGLPVRPFFYPLSSLPAFPEREAEGRRKNPVAYDVSERGINLPSALNLTESDLDAVSGGIRQLLGFK